jgi:hypothetical protein
MQGSTVNIKAMLGDCKKRCKNVSIVWIDYQKAFDNVPHSWIENSIELLGLNKKKYITQNMNGAQNFS